MEITFDGGKVVAAHTKDHVIKTDQSVSSGGENNYPSPFELYLASIGTCAGVYVKSFCDNRKIPTDRIRIIQTVKFDEVTGLPSHIKLDIKLPEDFPPEYISAVVKVAELCKVKKSITSPPLFEMVSSVI
jgi:putative redox protein